MSFYRSGPAAEGAPGDWLDRPRYDIVGRKSFGRWCRDDPTSQHGIMTGKVALLPDKSVLLGKRSRDGIAGRRTTLTAIAAEAGVSLPTVSKVLNGRPDVAPATRARVERLLDKHHYARGGPRKHRRSGLIDLVFNGLDSPWAVELLRGVEEWGTVHETGVAVSSVRHGNARPASWTSTVASHDTDGVILVTSELTGRQLEQLRTEGIPLVVVDPVNPPPADLPSVGATNWAG